jgi:TRAP-type transport system periplasmic protein
MWKSARTIALCAIAAFFAVGVVARAGADEIELKAVSTFPRTHPNTAGFLKFIDAVNAKGKGLVHIKFIGGPEVAPPPQQPIALRNGLFDMVFGPCTYYVGLFPECDFTAGFKTPMEARKLGGYKLVDGAMRQKLGATFLARFDSGLGLYLSLENKPQFKDGLPNLSGMKIRSSPAYRDFIKELGSTAVVTPISQIYTALERGVVEGVGGDLDDIQKQGLYKYLKYWIEPPFDMAGVLLIANADKWDHLPPKVSDLIQSTAIDYEKITMDNITARTKKVEAFMTSRGMQPIVLVGDQAKNYVDTFMKGPWERMRKNPTIKISIAQLRRDWY